MRLLLRNALFFSDGKFVRGDVSCDSADNVLSSLFPSPESPAIGGSAGFSDKYCIVPGFVDVHVHLREPGFSYKETIADGTRAAKSAGYCAVCCMPNVVPAPDSADNLSPMLDIIRRDAAVDVYPYGTITKNREGKELSDMESLVPYVVGFSDDGSGVADEELMKRAMETAKKLNKPIAAHCEVMPLVNGGVIHDGFYAREHSLPGICSESEWRMIERDLKLCAKTGVHYHVCHISCKESVALIRSAKKAGLNVTCETAPHYLVLCEDDMNDDGKYKMNPPLRSLADREALLEGVRDGTVDVIATDHAPHSPSEKAGGLMNSPMGITGLETAFPVLYTNLVKKGIISAERLIELMATAPARIFGIDTHGRYTVLDLGEEYVIDPSKFLSKGKCTPFEGMKVCGKAVATLTDVR